MQGNVQESFTNSADSSKAAQNAEGSEAASNNVRARLASPELSTPASKMLMALNASGKPMYQGTVDGVVKAKRRKAGKAARAARKAGRA